MLDELQGGKQMEENAQEIVEESDMNQAQEPQENESVGFNSGFPSTPMLEMNVGGVGLGLNF